MSVEPLQKINPLGVSKATSQALLNGLWPQHNSIQIDVTFDGGTTNGIGDVGGTDNPHTLFTVTGLVEVTIIALVTTDLAGATGTVEVGTATHTARLLAQATGTALDAKDIWHDGTPDATVEVSTSYLRQMVSDDIILTAATADITAGVIRFIVLWNPISSDGNVVAA